MDRTLFLRERPTCPPYHLSHDKISRKNSVYIIIFVNTIPRERERETKSKRKERDRARYSVKFVTRRVDQRERGKFRRNRNKVQSRIEKVAFQMQTQNVTNAG